MNSKTLVMKMKSWLLTFCVGVCCGGWLTQKQLSPDILFYESFDSKDALVNPEVGVPGIVGNFELVEGVKGKALATKGGKCSVSYAFPTNFIPPKGCIEFWAKLDADKSSFGCSDPRLFWIRFANGEESHIEFTANNGMANGGLYGRMVHFERVSHRGFSSSELYANILGSGKTQDWHHYAITWNKDGVTDYLTQDGKKTLAVLFVDGKPHKDVSYTPHHTDEQAIPAFFDTVAKASVLGFSLVPEGASKDDRGMPYRIDEFKIWKVDKVRFNLDR